MRGKYTPKQALFTVKEAGRNPPPFPFIFFKPTTCILDHGADVVVPKICQDQADYEGELCIVIGRDTKDVGVENALDYIAAYTCGNDISSRKLQRDPKLAGNVPQWGFSKGFDTFAPLGPCLVRPDLIGDPKDLRLVTKIDGEIRQEEMVNDLLFDCAYLVSYLSSGTTLRKGSIIMTGTPGGESGSTKASAVADSRFQVSELALTLHAISSLGCRWRLSLARLARCAMASVLLRRLRGAGLRRSASTTANTDGQTTMHLSFYLGLGCGCGQCSFAAPLFPLRGLGTRRQISNQASSWGR